MLKLSCSTQSLNPTNKSERNSHNTFKLHGTNRRFSKSSFRMHYCSEYQRPCARRLCWASFQWRLARYLSADVSRIVPTWHFLSNPLGPVIVRSWLTPVLCWKTGCTDLAIRVHNERVKGFFVLQNSLETQNYPPVSPLTLVSPPSRLPLRPWHNQWHSNPSHLGHQTPTTSWSEGSPHKHHRRIQGFC